LQFTKASGALAIVFAVLSAGFFIAAQCHNEPVSHITTLSHSHGHETSDGVAAPALLTDLCIGMFFLTLIFGSKFILKLQKSLYQMSRRKFREALLNFSSPPYFTFALSLPQLGTFRI
jgi:hypothetical protein